MTSGNAATLEERAAVYFHDPRGFLLAFAKNPAAALAKLEADPAVFGPRHVALSIYGRQRASGSLLAAARRQAGGLRKTGAQ